tara:strand:- start:15336 stop:18170 length:2835 start_codon:yes stop_codon:yes gene_type:complete
LPVYGQGLFSSTQYQFEEFKLAEQIHDVVQDSNQILFFVDSDGYTVYDSNKWMNLHLGNEGAGRSILIDDKGQLYVSGFNDFGLIRSDSLNQLSYHSVSDQYYSKEESINVHRDAVQKGEAIYKYGNHGLDIIYPDTLLKFPFTNSFANIFKLKGKIYVNGTDGIYEFRNDEYHYVESSRLFKDDILTFSFSFTDETELLGFKNSGLYLFNGSQFRHLKLEKESQVIDDFVYTGVKLSGDLFGVGTLYGGVYIFDNDGNLIRHIHTGNDLLSTSKSVLDLYVDHEENLWVNMWGGIQTIPMNLPVTYFGKSSGIIATIDKLLFKDSVQYLNSADHSIYRRTWKSNSGENTFLKTEHNGILFKAGSVIYLISLPDGQLFVESESGFEKVSEMPFSGFIKHSEDPLMLTLSKTLFSLNGNYQVQDSIETDIEIFKGIQYENDYFLFDRFGNGRRVKNTSIQTVDIETPSSDRIAISDLVVINGKLFLTAEGGRNMGIYEFIPEKNTFIKSPFFRNIDKDLTEKQVLTIEQCGNGDIWVNNNMFTKRIYRSGEEYRVERARYNLIGEGEAIHSIKCDRDGVWFGGTKGLYQLTDPEWEYPYEFRSNITGVYVHNDSLIYGGFGEPDKPIVLSYKDNELRFTFSAASYIAPERNEFSVKLDGFDANWSNWTTEPQKDYTNIPEGAYTFLVKSRNVFEMEGSIDRFSFRVLPPWYRTWWAYMIYAVLIFSILYAIYKIRVAQLLKVERMRTKIASDLHDEVSATLTGISFFAEAVERDSDEERKKHFVDLIKESAGDAKEKITDIVWSINPDNDNWIQFLAKCRRYASDLLESSGLEYTLKIDEVIPGKLTMEVRQHLWMIYKEMLTNVVRHSNAKRVDVILGFRKSRLMLVVQDNGNGMMEEQKSSGNGVNNIRKRAKALHAELDLQSDQGSGTRWTLIINPQNHISM